MSFENKNINPDYSTAKAMIVGFQDNRAYVLDRKQLPSFCGQMKSTAQIPYNIQTQSGKPLAVEFTNSVVGSLAKLGIKAQPMTIGLNTQQDSILAQFNRTDAERLVYFNIKQWESNMTPRVVDIRYDVTWELIISVYDRMGNLLATKSTVDRMTTEEPQLAGSQKFLQQTADKVFVAQVKALLNDPGVKASLVN
ncbi:MAG TPA: hypothetical protein VK166_08920 [Chitinophagaceae bacterium]|nr:hypothetical protein [Chitinophagaceae bacterium]